MNYEFFEEFIDEISKTGIKIIYVHARNAILSGISPQGNRTIPALNYDFVKKIKNKFPDIEFILNGGIDNLDKAQKLLEEFDGVMANGDAYAVPGSARIGQPQIISALLFMWGRMFDELKQMIDHVSNLVHVDYDSEESVADQMLPFLAEYYGIELSNMFRNSSYDQFFAGEDVVVGKTSNLKALQNEMWRRILIMPTTISRKG